MKIGIPQAGIYYEYYPFWKKFFEGLGFEIVLSPKTDKSISELGLKTANSESCLPIKIFYGHINCLRRHGINTFLLPHMDMVRNIYEKIGPKSYFCPYFVAMADVMKAEYPEIEVINPKMIFDGNIINSDSWIELALKYGKNKEEAQNIFNEALKEHLAFLQKMQSEKLMPIEIFENVKINSNNSEKIAIIGHSYIVYDHYSNIDLIDRVISKGYSVWTKEMMTDDEREIAVESVDWQCHNHWVMTNEERMAILKASRDDSIKGIIYVIPFNCGPDFLMEYYSLKDARKSKPITSISIDESSGEAGLATRIEAFIDVLK
ncbi:MAG: acyl-CoA dehydratase activase-related protein [Candidatus Buchananbacteria bacterium]